MFSREFQAAGRRIFTARLISFVGSAFTEFAVPLYLIKKAAASHHIGLQWVLVALIRVAAGYLTPRLRLRWSDRKALVWLDVALAMSALMPVLLRDYNVILGCYLATGFTAFLTTLQAGYIDSLVGVAAAQETKREAARAWLLGKIENGRHLGMLVGYGAAYFVAATVGFREAFMIDAASFIVSALLFSSLVQEGHIEKVAAVASYSILWRPGIRTLTISQVIVGFALFLYNATHVVVMTRDLRATTGAMSLHYIFQYVGYFLGSRVPSRWVELKGHALSDRSTVIFRFCVVPVYCLFAFAQRPWQFILGNTIFSFIIGASLPGAVALFQRAVPSMELRALGAARLAVTSMAGALGAACASVWMEHAPASHIYLTGAALHFVATLFLMRGTQAKGLVTV